MLTDLCFLLVYIINIVMQKKKQNRMKCFVEAQVPIRPVLPVYIDRRQ